MSFRNTTVAFLLAFAACTGCTAAAKAPVPSAANDAALAKSAGTSDRGVCRWLLLGHPIGFRESEGSLSTTAGYAGGTASTATMTRSPRRTPVMLSL